MGHTDRHPTTLSAARIWAPLALLTAAAVLIAGAAWASHHTPIERALQGPDRTEADKARDAGRKPAEVLAFYGIEPGMRVLEVGAGGGYYTAILDPLVGPDGRVLAQNSPQAVEGFLKDAAAARFGPEGSLPNTERYWKNAADWDLEPNSLDAVLIFLIYHHQHYRPDEGEALPAATVDMLAKIRAALKPGGVLGVIEHRAAPGSTRADSAGWHRVPAAMAKADITGAGFEFDGSSDIFTNPDDDERNFWRPTGLSGKTTRFVQRYRKPAQ